MIAEYRKWLDIKTKELDYVKSNYKAELRELKDEKEQLQHQTKALNVVRTAAESIQKSVHKHISSIVSRCLSAVFEETAYEFQIIFEQKRNRTEARLCFIRNGKEVDPTFACGGGVLDVASFALRLACLVLSRPAKRRLLVLDEPFKMLSTNYHGRVKDLLEQLSNELDVQIVMVTHSQYLQAGEVVGIE